MSENAVNFDFVFSPGGPHSGHTAICQQVVSSQTNVELVSVGQLLADAVVSRQPEDVDWDQVNQQITDGELVAEVRKLNDCISNSSS